MADRAADQDSRRKPRREPSDCRASAASVMSLGLAVAARRWQSQWSWTAPRCSCRIRWTRRPSRTTLRECEPGTCGLTVRRSHT